MSKVTRLRLVSALCLAMAAAVAYGQDCSKMNTGPDIFGQPAERPCVNQAPPPAPSGGCNCVAAIYTRKREITDQNGLFQECRGHYDDGNCRLQAGGPAVRGVECEAGRHDAPYGNWGVRVRQPALRNPPELFAEAQITDASGPTDCNQWPGTREDRCGAILGVGGVRCRHWHSCTCDNLRGQPNHFGDKPPAQFVSQTPNAPLAGFFRIRSTAESCPVALQNQSLDLTFGLQVFELDRGGSDLVTTFETVAAVVPMTCQTARCEGSKELRITSSPLAADALLVVTCAGINPPQPGPGPGPGPGGCQPGGSCESCCGGRCGPGLLCLADNLCHGSRQDRELGIVIDQCIGAIPPPPPPPPTPPPPPVATLTVAPLSLSFSATQGQPSPPARTISIGSSGAPLAWSATDNAPWLSLAPTAGTTPGTTNASVNAAALAAGSYTGTVTVSAPGVSSVAVPVALTVTAAPPPPPAAQLTANPATLSFTATQGGPNPAPRSLTIGSSGAPLALTLSDDAAFLTVTPSAGTTTLTANVAVSIAGLAPGTYSGSVRVTASGVGTPLSVPVSLTVAAAPPPPPAAQLTASPASLSFTATQGGPNPPPRALTIGSSGAPLAVTLSDDAAFLTVTPSAGTTTLTASVAVSIAGLAPGTYSGSVRATGSGAGNSPLSVPVSLTVAPPAAPAPPVITSFTPTSGPVGTVVRINGSSLGTTTEVRINNVPGSVSLGAVSNTQIDVTVQPVATSGPIRVTSPSGTATSPGVFTVVAVNTPAIDGFSPASGAPGTQVTIVGRNLQVVQNVFFNNQVTVFQEVAGGTQLRATVPSGATSGPIRVVTATGSATSAQSFTVTAAPPPPPVAQLTANPASLSFTATQGGTNPPPRALTIGSTGAPLALTLSDDAAFLSVSPSAGATTLTASVAVSIAGLAPGTYSGSVRATASGAGNSPLSVPVSLTVTPPAGPTITGFTPTSGPAGINVTINGTGFDPEGSVRFNGAFAQFSVPNSTRIDAIVPAGATTGPITVFTGTGTANSPQSFTVTTPAPAISSFSPTTGRPGDQVTVNGTNLNGVTGVKFNGVTASFTPFSPIRLFAVVPLGASTGPIQLSSPGGTATSGQPFVLTQGTTPTITGFSPASGPAGTNVTINGTNFDPEGSVQFNGRFAQFSVPSSTRIDAIVPANATTGPITVFTGTGTVTSGQFFIVTPQ